MTIYFTGYSTIGTDHKNNVLRDSELIKRDLLNQFYTRIGDRVMMPTYGSIIWDMLFEPLTASNKELIKEDVKRIINSEPRVELDNMIVDSFEYGIVIIMNLIYTPLNAVGTLEARFDKRNL